MLSLPKIINMFNLSELVEYAIFCTLSGTLSPYHKVLYIEK